MDGEQTGTLQAPAEQAQATSDRSPRAARAVCSDCYFGAGVVAAVALTMVASGFPFSTK